MDYLEVCKPLWDKYMITRNLAMAVHSWYVRNIPEMSGAKILAWSWRTDYLYEQSEIEYRAYIAAREELDAKSA